TRLRLKTAYFRLSWRRGMLSDELILLSTHRPYILLAGWGPMSVEHVHALAQGTRLNQYELMKILGTGGFGITYMARDTTLDTLVAIKEYLPSDFAVRQEDSQVTAKSSTSKGDFDWGLTR